jgi:hypothetical protein
MVMKYVITFLLVVSVLVIYLTWNLRSCEGFISTDVNDQQDAILNVYNAPVPDANGLRPCTVYFTDHVGACDRGELRYNRVFYEKKLQDIMDTIEVRQGQPTSDELSQISLLKKMIAAYDGLPNKKICKTDIPGWYEKVGGVDKPPLGNIMRNADRSAVDQWAFCFKPNGTSADIADTKLLINQDANGNPSGININNTFYLRGAFPSFDEDTIKSIYCKETASSKPYQFQNGFKLIDGASAKPTYLIFKNGINVPISQDIINEYFTNMFFYEHVYNENGYEVNEMSPQPRSKVVHKLYTDLCKRTMKEYSGQINIFFKRPILQKRIPLNANQDHLLGTLQDLRNALDKSIQRSNALQTRINENQTIRDTKDASLKKAVDEKKTADDNVTKYTNEYNNAKPKYDENKDKADKAKPKYDYSVKMYDDIKNINLC